MSEELPDPSEIGIIHFPHPTLRVEAKPLKRVDANLKKIVARMFELMYEHRGVGLAATQVDIPIRLFVMNATGEKGEGEELAVINPVISKPKSNEEAEADNDDTPSWSPAESSAVATVRHDDPPEASTAAPFRSALGDGGAGAEDGQSGADVASSEDLGAGEAPPLTGPDLGDD